MTYYFLRRAFIIHLMTGIAWMLYKWQLQTHQQQLIAAALPIDPVLIVRTLVP
ncbi:hypothetical protein BDV11DRAFT_194247 [Aspergillus similis]